MLYEDKIDQNSKPGRKEVQLWFNYGLSVKLWFNHEMQKKWMAGGTSFFKHSRSGDELNSLWDFFTKLVS